MAYSPRDSFSSSTVNRNLKRKGGFNIGTAILYTKTGKELADLHPFTCPFCHLILRDPFQLLECGCRYCQLCLENLFEHP